MDTTKYGCETINTLRKWLACQAIPIFTRFGTAGEMVTGTMSRNALFIACMLFAGWSNYCVNAAPVVVTSYPGLVGTVGSDDAHNTGERFNRWVVNLAGC